MRQRVQFADSAGNHLDLHQALRVALATAHYGIGLLRVLLALSTLTYMGIEKPFLSPEPPQYHHRILAPAILAHHTLCLVLARIYSSGNAFIDRKRCLWCFPAQL